MRAIWTFIFAILLPVMLLAQSTAEISKEVSDDRGFLTRLLETNLSGAGRQVTLDGFQGALSSRATFTQLTIADDEGAWLTLHDGAIQWNRSALLRGRIEIAELSAREILLPRLPAAGADAPVAEARAPGFSLPELPVSLNIDKIMADRVELGEPVIGVAAALSIDGQMSLAGGEGNAALTINRLDGPRGQFILDAGYANETQVLRLNLGVDEAADGLMVNLVGLYDKPAINAQISGEGALKDFAADIRLATGGQPRVTGRVKANAGPGADGTPGTQFDVTLGGDIATLVPPKNRAFFGPDTQLVAQGWRGDDGRLSLPRLNLTTKALNIDGALELTAQKAPQTAKLLITLGRDAGATELPVALPVAGAGTTVESGRIDLSYDATRGQAWTLKGRVGQLVRKTMSIEALTLDGKGAVVLNGNALQAINGGLDYGTTGLMFADQAMAQAVGSDITGRATFDFTPGNAVELSELTLNGSDYGLSGNFLLSGLSSGFLISADMKARYDDLSRLSGVAKRPMQGRADASIRGYYSFLTRGFDANVNATGTDIALNQPQLDSLLQGTSRIVAHARRDETGIDLEKLSINAQQLTVEGQGYLNSASSDVNATISMPSLSDADPGYAGSLEAKVNLTGATGSRRLNVSGLAEDLTIGIEALDNALKGRTDLAVVAGETQAGYQVQTFRLTNPQLTAQGKGSFAAGALDATATFALPDLSSLRADWAGALNADATIREEGGTRFIDVEGQGENLSLGMKNAGDALTGTTDLVIKAEEKDGIITLRDVRIDNAQLQATASGLYGPGVTDLTADVNVASLAPFGPDFGGALQAKGSLKQGRDGIRHLTVNGTGRDIVIGQPQVDGALGGQTILAVDATEQGGILTLNDVRVNNPQVTAQATGTYGPGVTDMRADLDVASLASFGPGWSGAVRAQGSFREAGDGIRQLQVTGTGNDLSLGQAQVDGALAGETRLAVTAREQNGIFTIEDAKIDNPRLSADATGTVGNGKTDVKTTLRASDLRFLGNGISGSVNADARLRDQNGKRLIEAQGTARGLSLGQPRIDPLLRGQTSFNVAATQSQAGLSFQTLSVRNPQVTVDADGSTATGMNLSARLADLGLIQRELPGPLTVRGSVRETGKNFALDLDTVAPGNTQLAIKGTVARNFSNTALSVTGSTNAAIANSFIRTRSVQGPLSIDLNVNGPPGLNAVSGRVRLTGGEVADPGAGIRLEELNGTADLANGRIAVDVKGDFVSGGSLAVSGPVDLSAGTLDLGITLNQAVLRDPNLYETIVSGQLRMSGRNGQGPLISGMIDMGETEIRIPSTGLGGAKAIPDINHVGDTRPIRATRAKAGLEPFPSQASSDAGMAGPPSTPPSAPPRLDLQINAPNQVFIRGRGVDAEMGGAFRITGTTRKVIPVGRLELIRGRVDLLGKRFDLSEGLVELQGSLIPVIRLVATTVQDGITTRIIIDGEARDPDITFESSPELPEEEVLSQLLFGRGLDNISPFQAAQLANAIAVLAGRAGEGIVGRLRNQVGLDDLDLATDDEGNVQVRAGKYLTDNLYTDVAVGDDGKSSINLNLDVTDSLTARGSVGSDGDSSLGLFFERDY